MNEKLAIMLATLRDCIVESLMGSGVLLKLNISVFSI